MLAVMCVCHHVCHTQARSCLSTVWALNRCFAWFFGTTAVLVQGVGGGVACSLIGAPDNFSGSRVRAVKFYRPDMICPIQSATSAPQSG